MAVFEHLLQKRGSMSWVHNVGWRHKKVVAVPSSVLQPIPPLVCPLLVDNDVTQVVHQLAVEVEGVVAHLVDVRPEVRCLDDVYINKRTVGVDEIFRDAAEAVLPLPL